jgi:hypothetical protein
LSSRGENGSTRRSAVTGQRPAVLGVFFFLSNVLERCTPVK